MYFVKNITCLKVSGKNVSIVVFSSFVSWVSMGRINLLTLFVSKSCFRFLRNNCSNSCFWKEIWQPFVHLINSIASRNVWKLLNWSYLQKVAKTFFKNSNYFVNKFKQVINVGPKSTRRGLFGRQIDKIHPQVDPQWHFWQTKYKIGP